MKNLINKFSSAIMFFGGLLTIIFLTSQNNGVGINTTSPQEELDVHGDINVTGMIKPNMQAGTDGQILQAQANGTLEWVDLVKYKNYKVFRNYGSYSWTVPTGVNRVKVELWGGGGYGYQGGGGGGGGYASAELFINSNTATTIAVGRGGRSGYTAQKSSFSFGGFVMRANEGGNATSLTPGIGGDGGYINSPVALFEIDGEDGSPSNVESLQTSATDFSIKGLYGKGGNTANFPMVGGKGGIRVYNYASSIYTHDFTGTKGHAPGGGGGGYVNRLNGGDGMVILRW